jgi:hypothetical protein
MELAWVDGNPSGITIHHRRRVRLGGAIKCTWEYRVECTWMLMFHVYLDHESQHRLISCMKMVAVSGYASGYASGSG